MSDRADKKADLAPSLIAGGNRPMGIIPRTFEDAYRIARVIKAAGDARSEEIITTCILHGLEVGLPPMQAAEVITIINGRRSIYGDGVPALLWSNKFKIHEEFHGEAEDRIATCRVTRPEGDIIERRFSVRDAKTAQLWGKSGPWKNYPDRMLQMRARGFAARDGASDVLRGLILVEEAQDIPMRDITPGRPGHPTLDVPDDILSTNQVSEAETSQDAPLANVAEYLRLLGERLEAAENLEALDEVWEAHEQLVEAGRMTPDAVRQAEILCEKHSERFAISGKPE